MSVIIIDNWLSISVFLDNDAVEYSRDQDVNIIFRMLMHATSVAYWICVSAVEIVSSGVFHAIVYYSTLLFP